MLRSTGRYIAYVADPDGGLIIKPRTEVKESELNDLLCLCWEDSRFTTCLDWGNIHRLVFNALSRYGYGIDKYKVTVIHA